MVGILGGVVPALFPGARTAHHMHVEVVDLLAAVRAGVDHRAEAVVGACLRASFGASSACASSSAWWRGSASASVAMCSRGMISRCTGAAGRMS